MSAVLTYVKSFLALFLLIKILGFFVPKNGFSKYISFFSGVILVLGMLYPILQLFSMEETWLEQMYSDTFEEQMLEVSFSADYIKDDSIQIYQEQIETFVETEIRTQVENEGFRVKELMVNMGNNYEWKSMKLIITGGKEEEYSMLKEKLMNQYQLPQELCEIAYE